MTSERALLARGGIAEADVDALVAGEEHHGAPRFQPLLAPDAAEELGRRLAAQLTSLRPDRILIAGERGDEVVAFVVARELGCPVAIVWESEGLLSEEGEIRESERVVVFSESFRSEETLRPLALYVAYRRASVAAACALIDTPALQREATALGTPAIALARRT